MSEQTPWLRVLASLKWSVASLVELHEKGSWQREVARNAADGIRDRIDWIIAQADAEIARLAAKK